MGMDGRTVIVQSGIIYLFPFSHISDHAASRCCLPSDNSGWMDAKAAVEGRPVPEKGRPVAARVADRNHTAVTPVFLKVTSDIFRLKWRDASGNQY